MHDIVNDLCTIWRSEYVQHQILTAVTPKANVAEKNAFYFFRGDSIT